MRQLLLALSFILSGTSHAAKTSEAGLKEMVAALDQALIKKDTLTLNRILSSSLQYGHSNGWIESKEALKANLYNGKLSYKSITPGAAGLKIAIEGSTGIVREEVAIEVLLDGKPLDLTLSVMQVWVAQKGEWKLLARQSTKLERH